MLVLSKKLGEKLVIAPGVIVTVMEALNGQVKLGVEGPVAGGMLQGQGEDEAEEAAFHEHWLRSTVAWEKSNLQIDPLEATLPRKQSRIRMERRSRIRQPSPERLCAGTIRRDCRPTGRLQRQTDQTSRRSFAQVPSKKRNATTSAQTAPNAPSGERERDVSIRSAVLAAIRSTHYRPLWTLSCEVSEGVTSLLGTVPSFYLKQLAQEVVLRLECVSSVVNLVDVQVPSTATEPMS